MHTATQSVAPATPSHRHASAATYVKYVIPCTQQPNPSLRPRLRTHTPQPRPTSNTSSRAHSNPIRRSDHAYAPTRLSRYVRKRRPPVHAATQSVALATPTHPHACCTVHQIRHSNLIHRSAYAHAALPLTEDASLPLQRGGLCEAHIINY